MNYLTHLFLAGTNSEIRTGALMGDFLRGVDRCSMPEMVQHGIRHHLAVDSFTDSHYAVQELKPLFSKTRRRFAGIILDVTFDYFLLRNWSDFSDSSPELFIKQAHKQLLENSHIMPVRMKRVVNLLIQHEVLLSYKTISGVAVALDRIADRFSRDTGLYGAENEIIQLAEKIESGFFRFFPELHIKFSEGKIPDLPV